MTARVTPNASVFTAVSAMIAWRRNTTTTSTRPHAAALRTVGRRKRSRVRSTVAPRNRSWGKTSRTTKSTIIGSEIRKLPVHVHRSEGK